MGDAVRDSSKFLIRNSSAGGSLGVQIEIISISIFYGCVVDALCRKGLLQEAVEFIESRRISTNAVNWRIVLFACAENGEISSAALARKRLIDLDPEYAGDDLAIGNVYARKEMWKEKAEVRKSEDRRRRCPGRSLSEIGGRLHEFVAGDRRHCRRREILLVLRSIADREGRTSPFGPTPKA